MISIKHVLSTLLVTLTLAATGPARADEPIQPTIQITFSEGVLNKETKEPMPEGNWAFNIAIENPNDRDLFCRSTTLTSRLGIWGNQCERADYISYIDLTPVGAKGITIKSGETFQLSVAGYDEREAKSKAAGKDLEFCGAEANPMKCGFICPNGKLFDEEWKEPINNGGYRKFLCDSQGEIKLTEVMCDSEHRPGDSWIIRGETSIQTFSCGTSGGITESVECVSSPSHSKNAAGVCVPTGCGPTPHGATALLGAIENGKMKARCEYGQWVDEQRDCNAGFKLVGLSCQAYASCGIQPHASEWLTPRTACPASCQITRQKYRCEDGVSKFIENKLEFCTPKRGVCA